jgi:hypothetical protein
MRIGIIGVLLVAGITLPAGAQAQSKLTFAPSVSVSAITDDNILTTAEARSADQTTLLSPAVLGAIETPRATLRGSYSIDMRRAADLSVLNDLEARRHGMLGAAFRQTPRLALDLNGRYDRSDEAGELNFETAILMPRTRATRWELGPSFTYRATPLVTIQGNVNWLQESVEHGIVTDEHVGRIAVSRQISGRASIDAGYVGRRFVNGDGLETSNVALVGATYALGPFTTLSVRGGPRYSTARHLEPEIAASLGRRAENVIQYAFDYWRGESIVLNVLGPVEVTSATGRLSVPLRHKVEVGTGGGVFDSESLVQGKARVYHVEAVGSWKPKALFAVSAKYGADFQHGDIRTSLLNDRDIVRHVFVVELTVAPRLSRTILPAGPRRAAERATQGNQGD